MGLFDVFRASKQLSKHEKAEHQNSVNKNEISLQITSDDEQTQDDFDRNTREALHALFQEFESYCLSII